MIYRVFATAAATALLFAGGNAFAQTAAAPSTTAAPDPARMAVARDVAVKLFPLGSYKRMMGEGFDQMMAGMTGSMTDIPVADLARLGGLEEVKVRQLGDARLGEIMAIYDPHWRERVKIATDTIMELVLDMMSKFEPRMQEAIARAYARDFTLTQLTELRAFLSTPTGTLYADRSLMVFTDKEMIKETSTLMPEIMALMPAVMEKMKEAEAGLPPRRKIEELSDAERKKLAGLFGVKVENLDDPEKVTTE